MCNFALVLQQPFFAWQSAGVTYKLAVSTYYPVAGNNNGYIVAAIGSCGCPYHFRIAQPVAQFLVADGFSKRNIHQLAPNLLLKRSAFLRNGQFKNAAMA